MIIKTCGPVVFVDLESQEEFTYEEVDELMIHLAAAADLAMENKVKVLETSIQRLQKELVHVRDRTS